jgi:hydrogenase small subunit
MGEDGLYAALVRRGMSRRTFLKFTSAMAAALALPAAYGPTIARAVEAAPRIPVIWLRGQACGGNTEALLRAADPTTANLLLEILAVDYHETLMTAAGGDASLALQTAMERFPNGYLAVIEGAVPKAGGGSSCLVGGRPFGEVAREVCDGALATIALGSCAFDGGAAGANGGTTDAEGVRSVTGDSRVVMLPGCPVNAANLAATIVHFVTFNDLPPADLMGRPLAFYGSLIHNQCERRPHFEFGEFALAWGDEGAQKGWCLYKVGCKGPETMGNCPTVRYGDGVSWNVRAGHGCIGCFAPNFWDGYSPAYRRLGSPIPFFPSLTVDTVGAALVGGIGVVAVAHGTGMASRSKYRARIARRDAERAAREAEGVAAADGTGGAVALAPSDAIDADAAGPGPEA